MCKRPVVPVLHFAYICSSVFLPLCSPYADNAYIIHFNQSAGTKDIFQSMRAKTEFLGLLTDLYAQNSGGRQLQLDFLTKCVSVFLPNRVFGCAFVFGHVLQLFSIDSTTSEPVVVRVKLSRTFQWIFV